MKKSIISIVLCALLVLTGGGYASAAVLLESAPGSYGTLAMPANDDGSSNLLPLPFPTGINFYGNTFNSFYVNNNGNITFNAPLSGYTPVPFPVTNQPMIAPFWGDVDTRGSGQVFVGSPDAEHTIVTWLDVGYYSAATNRTNSFQVVLTDRSADFAPGDFDIEFRYNRLEWTTGNASGGSGGLGGTPAQAGFDAGDNTNFFTLPGSRTAAVLDLQHSSNTGEAGVWRYAVRAGDLPGGTPDNPLLPTIDPGGGWSFDFNVDLNQTIFIDPVIAIGYDYEIQSGPNFASVLLPTGIGDDVYELWLYDDFLNDYVPTGISMFGGVIFDLTVFDPLGLDRFRVMGIEVAEELDPDDPLAFVTGLTFMQAGQVQMTQTAVTIDTGPRDPSAVPEPATFLLLGLGLICCIGLKKRS